MSDAPFGQGDCRGRHSQAHPRSGGDQPAGTRLGDRAVIADSANSNARFPTQPARTPTRTPPRTPTRTPVPDLGEHRARARTTGLHPRWPPSSLSPMSATPPRPTRRLPIKAEAGTPQLTSRRTQPRPTGAARQDVDGHADMHGPPPTTPSPQGQPATPKKGPPTNGPAPTGRQTSELRSRR